MSSQSQGQPARLRSVPSSPAQPASLPRLLRASQATSAPDEIRIVCTAALVEAGAVLASFELDSLPHPMWRGALGRALDGTLVGVAGRWHLDQRSIKVARVQAGRGADVARAVQTAVETANGYVAGRAEEGAARLAAAVAADVDLQREARDAAAALHTALGV